MEVGRGDRSSCLAEGLGSAAAGSGWVDRGEGKGLGFLFRFVVDAKKQRSNRYPNVILTSLVGELDLRVLGEVLVPPLDAGLSPVDPHLASLALHEAADPFGDPH